MRPKGLLLRHSTPTRAALSVSSSSVCLGSLRLCDRLNFKLKGFILNFKLKLTRTYY